MAAGGTVLDPEVVAGLLTRRPDPVDRLTDREREVLTLDLPQAPDDNRRVLAVLAWLDGADG